MAWRMTSRDRARAGAAAVALLVNGVARFTPGAHAAVHGDDVGVAHLLQVVGGQGGPEAAAAVKDDGGGTLREQRLDVALEHSAADMAGAGRPIDGELAVLAHIDEMKLLAAVQARLHVGDAAFTDVLPHRLDQGEEARVV